MRQSHAFTRQDFAATTRAVPAAHWCQWFAYQLQAEGLFDSSGRAFDGLLYPSRKNRRKEALALASTYVDDARPGIVHTEQSFKETPEYRQLLADPFRIAKP
jgi:hypothetical protein